MCMFVRQMINMKENQREGEYKQLVMLSAKAYSVMLSLTLRVHGYNSFVSGIVAMVMIVVSRGCMVYACVELDSLAPTGYW